jgi:hypothetical protein
MMVIFRGSVDGSKVPHLHLSQTTFHQRQISVFGFSMMRATPVASQNACLKKKRKKPGDQFAKVNQKKAEWWI